MIVVLQRVDIASVIFQESIHDRRLAVDREITDFDHEEYARQRIRIELEPVLLEILDTTRDSVIRDLRVVKCDTAIRIQYVETKFEIRYDRFIRVLAVDEA